MKSRTEKMNPMQNLIDMATVLSTRLCPDMINYVLRIAFEEELKMYSIKDKLYNSVVIKKNFPEYMCHSCYKDWPCRLKCNDCSKLLCPECYKDGKCLSC